MFLELLIGYWAFKPTIEEIDRFSYEQEIMLNEIEDLKEEVRYLKAEKHKNEKL